jgi:hypothetical protein
MRELEWRFRTVIDCGIDTSDDITYKSDIDAEPIAAIAIRADWVSPVGLTLIVKGDDIRIRDERGLVFVLDLDGGSGEDEAEVSCRPSVAERRMAWMAAKGADADQSAVE